MSKLRNAILKAADHIEQNPKAYSFHRIEVPECGTKGCMIGWIAAFMGFAAGTCCWGIDCKTILGVDSEEFMDRISQWEDEGLFPVLHATDAVVCLRRYADKYHPEECEAYPEVQQELDRIFATQVA